MQTKTNTTAKSAAPAKPAKPATTKTTKTAVKPKPATAQAKPAPAVSAAPKSDANDKQALIDRIAAERKTANEIFAQASNAVSVPIKPLIAYKRTYKKTVTAHAIGRKPSVRQAAALAVAIAANNAKAANGATIKRTFTMRGAEYAIENGALSDALASGLCTYNAESETITITNIAEIKSQIGSAGIKL